MAGLSEVSSDGLHKELGKYKVCPQCGYGFRIGARERLSWLVDKKPVY